MRRLLIITAMLLSISCASSSGSISEMRMFMETHSAVWEAAVVAMHDVGARTLVSNRASGILAGEVNRGELGGHVRLDVTVRPAVQAQDGTRSGSDISVAVTFEGGDQGDPHLKDDLKLLKDEYLDAVERNLTYVRGYR